MTHRYAASGTDYILDIRKTIEQVRSLPELPVMFLIGRKEAAEIEGSKANITTDTLTGEKRLGGIACKVVDVDSCCKAVYRRDMPVFIDPYIPTIIGKETL